MRLRGWEQDAELTSLPNTDDHSHSCSHEHTCLLPLRWPDCPGTLSPLLWPQKGKRGDDGGKRKAGNCHSCRALAIAMFSSFPQASLLISGFCHLHPRNPSQWTEPESLSLTQLTVRVGAKPQGPALVSGFFLATQFGIHKSFSCILGNKSYKLQSISTIRTFHCKLNKLVCLRLEAHHHLWHFEMGEQMLWIPNSFLINGHLKDRDRKYLIKSHGMSVSSL